MIQQQTVITGQLHLTDLVAVLGELTVGHLRLLHSLQCGHTDVGLGKKTGSGNHHYVSRSQDQATTTMCPEVRIRHHNVSSI